MANPKHLEQLTRGVAAWNAWRRRTRVRPDLKKADLRNLDVTRLGIAGATGIDFSQTAFDGAILARAHLRGADFTLASLRGANLESADLRETYFHASDLTNT